MLEHLKDGIDQPTLISKLDRGRLSERGQDRVKAPRVWLEGARDVDQERS